METKPDKRDCPKCNIRMENKGYMNDYNEDGNWCLYQCPKCKNIETLWEES